MKKRKQADFGHLGLMRVHLIRFYKTYVSGSISTELDIHFREKLRHNNLRVIIKSGILYYETA